MADVEVDVFAGLVGNIATEVTARDAMPDALVLLLERALHEASDELLAGLGLEGTYGFVHAVVLHLVVHVDEFDNGLSKTHGVQFKIIL